MGDYVIKRVKEVDGIKNVEVSINTTKDNNDILNDDNKEEFNNLFEDELDKYRVLSSRKFKPLNYEEVKEFMLLRK